jgi:hypothetical protein
VFGLHVHIGCASAVVSLFLNPAMIR